MTSTLTTELLVSAYSHGYFPMPHPETEEICWFHPDPRAILPLEAFHVSRSLGKKIRSGVFSASFDQDFSGVMSGCADRAETWINDEFFGAYQKLFDDGFAHSIEIWHERQLVGGSYGVSIGGAFFAESMFHRVADASKVALYYLTRALKSQGYCLLEVQFLTPHLRSLGAIEISSQDYLQRLYKALQIKPGQLARSEP